MESISSNIKKKKNHPYSQPYLRLLRWSKVESLNHPQRQSRHWMVCVDRITIENIPSKVHHEDLYSSTNQPYTGWVAIWKHSGLLLAGMRDYCVCACMSVCVCLKVNLFIFISRHLSACSPIDWEYSNLH